MEWILRGARDAEMLERLKFEREQKLISREDMLRALHPEWDDAEIAARLARIAAEAPASAPGSANSQFLFGAQRAAGSQAQPITTGREPVNE